ncbi:MAG: methyltransferase domain-containing protein [Gammaproteobacteria bacterium]|nr:methyltransferase domain-containing protein [Gammaproteobacteria bacterium]
MKRTPGDVDPSTNEKLAAELGDFRTLWFGGFKTGYKTKRNQRQIEDYLRSTLRRDHCVLEIGCGGGQWSRFMAELGVLRRLYCIDALSAFHNNFWQFVGEDKRGLVEYRQVSDFSLACIPDRSVDYVFSYDVFCHISLSGQREYLQNLRRKCVTGAQLLIMYADPAKYLRSEPENVDFVRSYLPGGDSVSYGSVDELIGAALADCDGASSPGRWYWVGIERFVALAQEAGYEVVARDLDIDKTNPLTLLRFTSR